MADGPVPYTDNYTDHSTDAGYQFEFICERCGNGYKSSFDASALGIGTKVLSGLSGLLGGRGSTAAGSAEQLRDLTNSQAKDKALRKAVEEIAPLFNQCHRCGSWVCKEICWNGDAGLCVQCAPKVEQELGAMQSAAQLQQLQEKVSQTDYASDIDVTQKQVALCPHCGKETDAGAKFCGECGKSLAAELECPKCGRKAEAGTKFCAECGTKFG